MKTVTINDLKEAGEPKRAPAVAVRKLEFVLAQYEDLETAIKDHSRVYLYNPKNGNSVQGFIIAWRDRDEGREAVLFQSSIRRHVRKVHIGNIYIAKKASS